MVTRLVSNGRWQPRLGLRVVSLVCVVSLVVLIAATISSLQLASRSLEESLAARLELLIWDAAREATQPLATGNSEGLDQIARRVRGDHAEVSAIRLSPIAGNAPWLSDPRWKNLLREVDLSDRTAIAVMPANESVRAVARVMNAGAVVGHVGIEFDLSEVTALRARLAWSLAGLGVFLLGLATLVVSIYMRRSVTNPLRDCGIFLGEASDRLNTIGTDMLEISKGTSAKARQVSDTSLNISTHIQSVASAVGQLSASISDISENAAESARVGDAAVQIALETNETVERLGKSSSEIGSVIRIINSIAEQTNLLALNATIEAARAGDAGRGFAVVAGQVKELARATSEATSDISQKVSSIQDNTESAVKAIEQISNVAGRIERMQTSIAAAVEEQAVTTSDIDSNIRQVADGAEDIALSIRELAQAAEGTSVTLTESREAAEQLREISQRLRELVG